MGNNIGDIVRWLQKNSLDAISETNKRFVAVAPVWRREIQNGVLRQNNMR